MRNGLGALRRGAALTAVAWALGAAAQAGGGGAAGTGPPGPSTVPGMTGPSAQVPGQTGASPSVPGQAGPAQPVTGQTGPAPQVSGQTGPAPAVPGQAGAVQPVPGESGPVSGVPGQPGAAGTAAASPVGDVPPPLPPNAVPGGTAPGGGYAPASTPARCDPMRDPGCPCPPGDTRCNGPGALRVDPNTTTGQRDPNVWTPVQPVPTPAPGQSR